MFVKKNAFSLIELLVVLATISLLTGGAVAFYANYSREVGLNTATKNFIDSLYLARKKARAGDTSQCPEGEEVFSYEVTKTTALDAQYKIFPICSSGTGEDQAIVRTLTSGVKFKLFPASPIEFKASTAFSSSATQACVVLELADNCRYVSVSAKGVIATGKLTKCSDVNQVFRFLPFLPLI